MLGSLDGTPGVVTETPGNCTTWPLLYTSHSLVVCASVHPPLALSTNLGFTFDYQFLWAAFRIL